jgi:hypothetical protein
MHRPLALGLVVLLACTAHAGGNPDVRIYFDFDPPNYLHEVEPQPYTMVNAYVCVDNLDDGFRAASFRTNDPMIDCPGVIAVATWQPAFMF